MCTLVCTVVYNCVWLLVRVHECMHVCIRMHSCARRYNEFTALALGMRRPREVLKHRQPLLRWNLALFLPVFANIGCVGVFVCVCACVRCCS